MVLNRDKRRTVAAMVIGAVSACAGAGVLLTGHVLAGMIVLMIGLSILMIGWSVYGIFYRIEMKEIMGRRK